MKRFNGNPATILLVEDNPGDVLLLEDSFSNSRISTKLQVAEDGEQALQILRKQAPYTHCSTPDLILLDLNLPKMSGTEVLKEVKNDAALKRIPVVILSSSKADRDILLSYELHANSYLVKPRIPQEYAYTVRVLEDFWFDAAALAR